MSMLSSITGWIIRVHAVFVTARVQGATVSATVVETIRETILSLQPSLQDDCIAENTRDAIRPIVFLKWNIHDVCYIIWCMPPARSGIVKRPTTLDGYVLQCMGKWVSMVSSEWVFITKDCHQLALSHFAAVMFSSCSLVLQPLRRLSRYATSPEYTAFYHSRNVARVVLFSV